MDNRALLSVSHHVIDAVEALATRPRRQTGAADDDRRAGSARSRSALTLRLPHAAARGDDRRWRSAIGAIDIPLADRRAHHRAGRASAAPERGERRRSRRADHLGGPRAARHRRRTGRRGPGGRGDADAGPLSEPDGVARRRRHERGRRAGRGHRRSSAGWRSSRCSGCRPSRSLGALASLATVYALTTRRGRTPVAMLLLAGVAINALLGAMTQFLVTLHWVRYEVAQEVLFWMLGGLDSRTWSARLDGGAAHSRGPRRGAGAGARSRSVPERRGDGREPRRRDRAGEARRPGGGGDAHRSVRRGQRRGRFRRPDRAARRAPGRRARRIAVSFPASALAGATFLIAADLVARTVHRPEEISLGVITACCGAPFFLWLLARYRREVGYAVSLALEHARRRNRRPLAGARDRRRARARARSRRWWGRTDRARPRRCGCWRDLRAPTEGRATHRRRGPRDAAPPVAGPSVSFVPAGYPRGLRLQRARRGGDGPARARRPLRSRAGRRIAGPSTTPCGAPTWRTWRIARSTSCRAASGSACCIARSLATEAPHILLDEPTANLDIAHALDVLSSLPRARGRRPRRRRGAARHQRGAALCHRHGAARSRPGCLPLDRTADVLTPEAVRTVFGVRVDRVDRGGDRTASSSSIGREENVL